MITIENLIKSEESISNLKIKKQAEKNKIKNIAELFYFNFSSISFLVILLFLFILNFALFAGLYQDTMDNYNKSSLFFLSFTPFLFVFLQKPIQDSITKYQQKSFNNTIKILINIFISFLLVGFISSVLFLASIIFINHLTDYKNYLLLMTIVKLSISVNLISLFWFAFTFVRNKKNGFYIKEYKKENIELNNELIQKKIYKIKLKEFDIKRKIINSVNTIDEYDYFKILVAENNLINVNNLFNKIEEKLLKESSFKSLKELKNEEVKKKFNNNKISIINS